MTTTQSSFRVHGGRARRGAKSVSGHGHIVSKYVQAMYLEWKIQFINIAKIVKNEFITTNETDYHLKLIKRAYMIFIEGNICIPILPI